MSSSVLSFLSPLAGMSPELERRFVRLALLRQPRHFFLSHDPEKLHREAEMALVSNVADAAELDGGTVPLERAVALARRLEAPLTVDEWAVARYTSLLRELYALPPLRTVTIDTLRDWHARLTGVSALPSFSRVNNRHSAALEALDATVNEAWADGRLDPLLVGGFFVFQLLRLAPFPGTTERLARLLTHAVCRRVGSEVGRYTLLDRLTMRRWSKVGLESPADDAGVDLWQQGFLDVLIWAYETLDRTFPATARSAVKAVALDQPGQFRLADLVKADGGSNPSTVRAAVDQLRAAGLVWMVGPGEYIVSARVHGR